jgi:hypothetical protein
MNATFIRELDTLLARHNLVRTMSRGNIVISDLQAKGDEGKNMMRLYGSRYGVTEQDHGAIVTIQGKRYKVIGIAPSRPKNLFDIECLGTGKVYRCGTFIVPQLVAQRGRQPAPAPARPQFTPPAPAFQVPAGLPQF